MSTVKIYSHTQRVRILYKTILKLHRGLPTELQDLGTNYTKSEFKRHTKCSPEQANIFMNEWTDYAITLAQQIGIQGPKTKFTGIGRQLSDRELNYFRNEQIQQLYELMMTATDKEDNR